MNLVYRFVHRATRAFFGLYNHWEIIGHEKIPASGPVIVTPNHVSYVDPPLIGSAIQRECAFMAASELWNYRFLRWLLPQLGCFPIHRGRPDRAAMRSALDALQRGLVLVMFPEGTRSPDGVLKHAEAGVGLIVQKSGAPVVPCALIGPREMMPVGSGRPRRVKLKVVFGDPLWFTPDTAREEVLATIMRHIAALLTKYGVPSIAAEDRPDALPGESEGDPVTGAAAS